MKLTPETTTKIAAGAMSARATGINDAIPVPSPCSSVCKMDPASGLCLGCLRNIDEIGLWGNADAAFKRQVWANIERRLAQFSV